MAAVGAGSPAAGGGMSVAESAVPGLAVEAGPLVGRPLTGAGGGVSRLGGCAVASERLTRPGH